MLDKLLDGATFASRVAAWLGGAMLLFAAFMTTAEVFLRKFFNFSFGGADEISGYMFAISTAFAFGFTLLQRGNVRIDALYINLPGTVRHLLDVFALLMLGGFLGLMTWRAFLVWHNSWISDSVSITPMVTPLDIPQGFWAAGLIFTMVVFTILLLRVIVALVHWDRPTLNRLIGARSLDEEIEEETRHAREEIEREHRLSQRGDN
jgi:TRAP-type C4-dicarboxylate transport system permease small subunit